MSCNTISKKKAQLGMWTAVDRLNNKLIDFILGDCREQTGRKLQEQLIGIQTKQVYTDYRKPYEGFIPLHLHTLKPKEKKPIQQKESMKKLDTT